MQCRCTEFAKKINKSFTFTNSIKRLFKYLIQITGIIVLALLAVIWFISPIAEYAIEKYDTRFTGREIDIQKLHINIFNGKIEIKGIKLFEPKSDKTLFTSDLIFLQLDPYKVSLKQEYDIKMLRLSGFEINVIQKGSQFNFDDLLKLGAATDTVKTEPKQNRDTTRWWVRQIDLNHGRINYNDKLVGIQTGLRDLRVFCPGLAYNQNAMRFSTAFKIVAGGSVEADLDMNSASLNYKLNGRIRELELNQLYPYLREVFKAKTLQGQLFTAFWAKGNFSKPDDLALKGKLGISGFKVIDVLNDSLALFKQLNVSVDSINLKRNIFNLRNIELVEPYVKVDMFENGTNFNRLMNVDTSVVAAANGTVTTDSVTTSVNASSTNVFLILADYVKSVARDYILNSYSADEVVLRNGTIDYSDYTLGEQFYARLDSLNIRSSRISSENSRITAAFSSRINNSGKLSVDIGANPKDFLEMELKTDVKTLPLVMFNPYMLYYLAHPLKKGDFNFKMETVINPNHDLKSDNHLLIEKIKVGKRDKTITTAAKVPLRMGVALLKDTKGNIDFKFPVTGNLNDPKYKLNKVILKIFQNLLLKAVTSPFKAIGSLFKKKEQETEFEFDYLARGFNERKQRKTLERTAELLKDKPELVVEFTQNVNPDKEMEWLAYREAKKIYLREQLGKQLTEPITEQDEKELNALQNKDSAFVTFVQSRTRQLNKLASHLDKCKSMVGLSALKKMQEDIVTSREAYIEQVFNEAGIDKQRLILVRNINRKSNLNQVKPILSFEMDTKDESDELKK